MFAVDDTLIEHVGTALDVSGRAFAQRARRRAFPVNAHREVEIAWVEHGSVGYTVGSSTLEGGVATAFVVPAGVEHVTTFHPAMRARSLYLSASVVEGVSAALGMSLGQETLVLQDARRVVELAATVSREIAGTALGRELVIDALTEALVVEILRAVPGTEAVRAPCDPRVHRAVELIHARYAEALTLETLARASGMSRYHFTRTFGQEIGCSPYRYLMQVRIERAQQLLRTSRRSITEVALSVGFTDLGRFARAFKAQVGVLPSQLARRAARPEHEPRVEPQESRIRSVRDAARSAA